MTLPHDDHPMKHYDRTCPACNMPPLPEPFFGMTGFIKLNAPYSPAFASYQMEDYGQQCYRAGRDAAREDDSLSILYKLAYDKGRDSRKPISVAQIFDLMPAALSAKHDQLLVDFARAIEAAHGIKT